MTLEMAPTTERVEALLKEHDLDFDILKVPMVGRLALPEPMVTREGVLTELDIDSPYFGLLNTKTKNIIHTVKKGYYPAQNSKFMELALRGIDLFDTNMTIAKAGPLNGGRKVFVQIQVDGGTDFNGDKIVRYITILNSNDGTMKFCIGIGEKVMSCMNQMFFFYKEGQTKFSHTASLEKQLEELPYLIEAAFEKIYDSDKVYQRLFEKPVTEVDVDGMVNTLIGVDLSMPKEELEELSTRKTNMMNELYNSIRTEMSGKGDNAWGLFNGATQWITHKKSKPKRDNGFEESMMVGGGYKTTVIARDYAYGLLN